MPVYDWQFWLVSILALAGGWVLVRPLLGSRAPGKDEGGCPTCATGSASIKKSKRRVDLTIEQRKI